MSVAAPIDFAAVADRADLRALVTADLGPPDRSRKWRCPFHDDHNPSLGISPDGRRFKCWSGRCGASGDALDWVRLREDLSVVEAARKLDPSIGAEVLRRDRPAAGPGPTAPARPAAPPPAWHGAEWQAAVEDLIALAEQTLWSPEGRPFLDWLRARGLADATIRRFRLGALPAEGWTAPVPRPDGAVAGIRHERGILLPWAAPGAAGDAPEGPRWCGANVRRLMLDPFAPLPPDEDKCRALRGSERGHLFPWPEVLSSQGILPALVVEGEFDALLGCQEAGHVLHVGTVGGANQPPRPSALAALALCPWLLISTDHDAAGVEAARAWRDRAPHKARRVLLPHGKDLSDFHAAGGDVAGWLAGELARLGIADSSGAREEAS